MLFRRSGSKKADEGGAEDPENGGNGEDRENGESGSNKEARSGGLLNRFRRALTKTREAFTEHILGALRPGRAIDEEMYEELEEALIGADAGVETTLYLMERLRETASASRLREASQLLPALKAEAAALLGEPSRVELADDAQPYVILMTGVNGVGKTTTAGKLAARFVKSGKRVVIAAADTFRAAAAEQLEIWSERSGAELVRQRAGADPASVVYDAIHASRARGAHALLIDTAGRLHTSRNLMEELAKIARVAGRELPGAPHETLLVLDATTGQNALSQGERFCGAVDVTGIALAKLDGSARGGAALAVRRQLGVPIKLAGVGEGLNDLRDFDPDAYIDALFEGV